MADSAHDEDFFFVDPEMRGIIPLDYLHVSKSLAKTVRANRFEVRVNTAFTRVMNECAKATPGREETWINAPIEKLYSQLNTIGHAHSVECWNNDELVGGLYGVSLGGAFFGESMFSRQRDASKVALVHLVGRLNAANFILLDTQFITPHLARLGAVGIARNIYQIYLSSALKLCRNFMIEFDDTAYAKTVRATPTL